MHENYMNEIIANRANVIVYTINGFQIRGYVVKDGGAHILVKSNGKTMLVYKHAISTISPA